MRATALLTFFSSMNMASTLAFFLVGAITTSSPRVTVPLSTCSDTFEKYMCYNVHAYINHGIYNINYNDKKAHIQHSIHAIYSMMSVGECVPCP